MVQAQRLNHLKELFAEKLNVTNITFLIVNQNGSRNEALYEELAGHVTFPTYQDTAQARVWSKLGGRKDDFYIYDRCGRLAYHLSLPNSILTRNTTALALSNTYYHQPCGPCPNATTVSNASFNDNVQPVNVSISSSDVINSNTSDDVNSNLSGPDEIETDVEIVTKLVDDADKDIEKETDEVEDEEITENDSNRALRKKRSYPTRRR